MTNYIEPLAEKVDRIEYYTDLLRDYATAPEKFAFWDWIMSHKLNREEAYTIIDTFKLYDRKLKDNLQSEVPTLDEIALEIDKILAIKRTTYTVNNRLVIQMLKLISNLMFKRLYNHFSSNEEDNSRPLLND